MPVSAQTAPSLQGAGCLRGRQAGGPAAGTRWTPHRSPAPLSWAVGDRRRPAPLRRGRAEEGCRLRVAAPRAAMHREARHSSSPDPGGAATRAPGGRRQARGSRPPPGGVQRPAAHTELSRLPRRNAPKCYGGAGRGKGQENSGPDAKKMPRARARLPPPLPSRPSRGALVCACAVPKGA